MSRQLEQDSRLLSVLIPTHNEAANLEVLCRQLRGVLSGLSRRWEILFVDDGSSDVSLDILRKLHQEEPRIGAISLSRNFGKEIAIAAGLRAVKGDAVIIMDGDLQHPPHVLGSFVARWREGYDMVYGQRLNRATDSPMYRILAKHFYRLFNFFAKSDIPDGAGDFRLLSRRAIDAMNRLTEKSRFNKGLYAWIGFRSIAVPYTVAHRLHGKSTWSARRLISFALDALTSFSTMPLRVSSVLGIVISLIAIIYSALFLTGTLLFGVTVPGFPSLIISVMFLSGAQLISLGIIGEYIGRVYDEVKARPLYLVAEEIRSNVDGDGELRETRNALRDRIKVAASTISNGASGDLGKSAS